MFDKKSNTLSEDELKKQIAEWVSQDLEWDWSRLKQGLEHYLKGLEERIISLENQDLREPEEMVAPLEEQKYHIIKTAAEIEREKRVPQRYNVICISLMRDASYLNYNEYQGDFMFDDRVGDVEWQTEFTLEELEELCPQFLNNPAFSLEEVE
jgi:hypothetical protein